MGIADRHLVEVGAPCDAWDREHAVTIAQWLRDADPVVGDVELLHHAAHPVTMFMINLMLEQWPGTDASADAELTAAAALSRRQIVVFRAAGIDGGMADLNLAVLDWIGARIRGQDDPEFASLVRERVDGLLDAGRRGRERGRRLRESSGPSEAPTSSSTSAGWLLRHPTDHYVRSARAHATDDRLCALLDGQIDLLAGSYARLAAGHVAIDQAELVVELEVLAPVAHGWSEPVATTVLATQTPSVSVSDRLGLRLVPDPDAKTFNGTLISVRGGERWLVCAHRLPDGTIVPDDGTHRIAA
ncbi:MAG: hypothetical protein ACR2NR_06050 [Solirubrobacteraceae bacterium]